MAQKQKKSGRPDAQLAAALADGATQLDGEPRVGEAARWLAGDDGVDLADLPAPLAAAAVEAAVRRGAVQRLQSLESAPKELRKLARAGLHRLKAAGHEVEAPRAAASFSLGREVVEPVGRAFMTAPDEQGYSEFVLGVTDEEGSCVLMGWFGGAEGFRQLSHGHVNRSAMRNLLREVSTNIEHMVEVPFTEALHHVLPSVEAAVRNHGHPPHDWDHFATHLRPEWLAGASACDPLGALPDQAEEGQLQATAVLAQHPWFGAWPVSEAAMADALGALLRQFSPAAEPAEGEEAPEPAPAEAPGLDAASARVLDDEGVRAEWRRRARLTATLARARAEDELVELLRHVDVALQHGQGGASFGLSEGLVRNAALRSFFQSMQQPPEGAAELDEA